MEGLVCDACQGTLLADSDVRYVVRIEGFAAYDPMELSASDLERDLEQEFRDALEAASRLTAEEAQDEVHRSFRFDLCPRCWRRFVKAPLGGAREPPEEEEGGGEEERKKSQGD